MEKTLLAINRRNFLQLTSITTAGLIIGLSMKTDSTIGEVSDLSEDPAFYDLTPFILIEKNGTITIFNPKPEMGQGTFQSIPSLIAEELEVSLDQVTIKQTGGEKRFGPGQGAGGSSSVRSSYSNLRKVGAAAKAMLITAAANQWKVPIDECYAAEARVFHRPSGKSISYGEVAEAASKLDIPKDPLLKDPKDFKLLGKNVLNSL